MRKVKILSEKEKMRLTKMAAECKIEQYKH